MVNKRVWNAVLGCNLKNDRMISVRFQGKPFNITVIQVYAPTSNTEEAETEQLATHSSTLAWKIPWTEESGRLQSMGSLRVRHDWATSLSLFTFMHWRRKWQPTPVFLPVESQGRGAWWASVYGVAQSRTQLKWLSSSSTNQKNLILSLNCIQREKSTRLLGWPKGSFENYKHTFWPTQY